MATRANQETSVDLGRLFDQAALQQMLGLFARSGDQVRAYTYQLQRDANGAWQVQSFGIATC